MKMNQVAVMVALLLLAGCETADLKDVVEAMGEGAICALHCDNKCFNIRDRDTYELCKAQCRMIAEECQ